jgi:uncharacterized Fe-S radical SAM superfamily protein PflX
MPEAALYQKLPDSRVRCDICQWHCVIAPNKTGVCQSRRNVNGKMEALNYARVSSINADPIEKKPLFHFFPGTQVLSLGTLGCNFHCIHCQNWQISCVDNPFNDTTGLQTITPQKRTIFILSMLQTAILRQRRWISSGLTLMPGVWISKDFRTCSIADWQR